MQAKFYMDWTKAHSVYVLMSTVVLMLPNLNP